jgi:hypothetical protein
MNKTVGRIGYGLAIVAAIVAAFAFLRLTELSERLNEQSKRVGELSSQNERLRCELADARVRLKLERQSALTADCRRLLRQDADRR